MNSSRYVQDGSLVHRKGVALPAEGITEEKETTAPDTNPTMSKDEALNSIKDMVGNTDTYVTAGAAQLAFIDNPLSTAPVYESLSPDQITYLPISETNDAVSVYKEYADTNGGVLRKDDEVVIKTTMISKANNNKLTYIEQLKGPRSIAKDTNNKITSFTFIKGLSAMAGNT